MLLRIDLVAVIIFEKLGRKFLEMALVVGMLSPCVEALA